MTEYVTLSFKWLKKFILAILKVIAYYKSI